MHPRLLAREGRENKQQTLFHQSPLQVKPPSCLCTAYAPAQQMLSGSFAQN